MNEQNNNLIEKLEAEYTDFTNTMLHKSKKEIINNSYEINSKEEIKDILSNKELISTEIEALLNQDNILNQFYHDWILDNTPVYDSKQNFIDNSIIALTEKYVKSLSLDNIEKER